MATPLNLSLIKAFKLLELVRSSDDGLTLSEVALRSGLTTSTAHRFLQTLRTVRALRSMPDGKYLIGDALSDAASAQQRDRQNALDILEVHVQRLSETLQDTIHVAVLAGDMVRYVIKGESPRSLKMASRPGTELEAYCTGLGKVLLAALSPADLSRYLRIGTMVRLTPNTITDTKILRRELARTRLRGYAIDNEEFEEGLRCVAVPIAVEGQVVAALSISGPTSRLKMGQIPHLSRALMDEAAQIGERLGRLDQSERRLL